MGLLTTARPYKLFVFANQVAKSGQKTLTSANLLQILSSPALWLVTGGQNTGLSLAGEFVLDILSMSSDRAPGKWFIWAEKVLKNKSNV